MFSHTEVEAWGEKTSAPAVFSGCHRLYLGVPGAPEAKVPLIYSN